ncbi:MAG: pyridoxal-phosphate dependent enzyme, partial [Proteobacteria bacterium]|nr:pyridoxal-phosphate dependent enzyme [Pseudomonadota bacterium]
MIGNTPMLKVTKIDTGCCELYLKLENQNPGGSIKDRIALTMIAAAEADGRLKPGGTLVEATAGNTGLGLALVASQKGYKLILVIPDKMSEDKIFHLKALGAECIITRSDVSKGHPEYYADMAERIAKETPGAFLVNQFGNPANPYAHETTTGPEIWEQMDHKVDAIVAGVGSGGTVAGLAKFFNKVSPETKMILADPEGSVLAEGVKTGTLAKEVGSWVVEGIGEDYVPEVLDLKVCDDAYIIPDKEAMEVIWELLRKEGIIAGSSTGTLLGAALRYCREQKTPKRVVTFVCDTGNKYLSKAFNEYWLIDQGFVERTTKDNLLDIIARRHAEHAVVTASPSDTLEAAFKRLMLYGISQLPVLSKEGALEGLIGERQIAKAIEIGAKYSADGGFQYVITMNSDMVPRDEFSVGFEFDRFINPVRLSDESETGGL